MYATTEMAEKLAERGFTRAEHLHGYFRLREGRVQSITYSWDQRDPKKLDVPPAEEVFWIATSAGMDHREPIQIVVPAAERCPDPVTCFVTAEVRGWKREV